MSTNHDQILRDLIAAFPMDFIELILPDVGSRIDCASVDFRKEEYFTDSPRGGRPRRPDLVAWAPTLTGDEVGIHVEIEARYRTARRSKLLDYNRLLSMRRSKPVHTAVIYCRGGPPGAQRQELHVKSLGRTIMTFRYDSLGLSGASAPEYLARPQPLAWGFAALMRPETIGSRAEVRVACLRRIVAARGLDEERRFLLFNFVATYIESDQRKSDEYDELFHREDNRRVLEEMMTWAEKIEARGYDLGRQQAREEMKTWAEKIEARGYTLGRQEGRQEGRRLLLRQLAKKFGALSPAVQQRIEDAQPDQILEWGERLMSAQSLEETFGDDELSRS